jgi:cyanophycinase-like exopeptidase
MMIKYIVIHGSIQIIQWPGRLLGYLEGGFMESILALIGGEEFSDGFESVHVELNQLIEGQAGPIVYLPTCAADDGNETVDYWCDLARQRLSVLGRRVETPLVIDRESANDLVNARTVAEASWIYLGGGYPHVGMRILRGTRLREALFSAIKRGVLLTGASAGAMLLCARSFVITPELSEEVGRVWESGAPPGWDPPLPPLIDCLGIVPRSLCAPHFNRFFPLGWLEHGLLSPSHSLIGIDEQTALICKDGKGDETSSSTWWVTGRGEVTLYRGNRLDGRYPAGKMVSL